MSDDLKKVKLIVTLMYFGVAGFIILIWGILIKIFNLETTIILFFISYTCFYLAGIFLLQMISPFIKNIFIKYKAGMLDLTLIGLISFLAFVLYMIFSYSEALAFIISLFLSGVIMFLSNLVWNRMKKRFKILQKIEEKTNKESSVKYEFKPNSS